MNLSTAETIQSQSNLMSYQFSQQEVSEMTNIMLHARDRFKDLSDSEFRSLVVQGIVHSYAFLIEKEFIISEYDQSYHRSHADESDQLDSSRVVCEVGVQVSQVNLSSKRPVVPAQQLRPIQQPNSHFKKNEHQNSQTKVEKPRPQSVNLPSTSIELHNKTAEHVSINKKVKNCEGPSAFAEDHPVVETARSAPKDLISPNAYISRAQPSQSTSKQLNISVNQEIFLMKIYSKIEQVKKAEEDASIHAKHAENMCFLVKEHADNAIRFSTSNIEVARKNESQAFNFKIQAQKQTQDTQKEALHCNLVASEIKNLLKIVNQAEQIQPQAAVRLTKVILSSLQNCEELARSASNSLNVASQFAQEAASYADKAKSAIRIAEQEVTKQNSSKSKNLQEVLMFKKRSKGSKQDEQRLMDLKHQLSQQRLKMKREALSRQQQ